MGTELKLSLDPDALREATMQAIAGVLTPEIKKELLQKAITEIVSPKHDHYSGKKGASPLEIAFQDAVTQLAREEARRMVAEDAALRAKLAELMLNMVSKMLEQQNGYNLAEKLAEGFLASIRNR